MGIGKKDLLLLLGILLLFCSNFPLFSQQNNLRFKTIPVISDTISIDSLTIEQNSLRVYDQGRLLTEKEYYFNGISRKFLLKSPTSSDSLTLMYRTFGINFEKPFQLVDSSFLFLDKGNKEDFLFQDKRKTDDFFDTEGIKKSGSISRGINFGNSQDLSVNSTLNLQLSGEISNNLNILASLTDDNLPIQPEGNTNQLQEFDQVFIQLYGKEYKVIAGDFWVKRPKGYFLNYNKRAQGLLGEYQWGNSSNRKWSVQAGGALSKGKFARNVIQGVEGNQGPYRLRGNDNEPFIIVLSGTEQVYIDGKLLERGQEFDYVIDYNTSEVTFMPNQRITKDSRIVIEFQYTDQNYTRSLFTGNVKYEGEKFSFWLNAFSEQDAKNQSLQQQLTDKDKALLSSIGDSLELARIRSIDSIGYVDNQVTYKMIDSLGIDSILIHSVNPDSAYYRAIFTRVGTGKGDYIFEKFTAVGKVFRWVAPINGVPQGDYEPSRVIATPKRNTLLSSGASYTFNEKWKVNTEMSMSSHDINTFSKKDDDDNTGYANRTVFEGNFKLGYDSIPDWSINTTADFEYTSIYFKEIERYRGVEFDRDWNVRNQNYSGQQILGTLSARLSNRKYGYVEARGQNFTYGKDYQGNRGQLLGKWNQKGFYANWDGSYLYSFSENKNTYLRHVAHLRKEIGMFQIGFSDDHELNQFFQGDSALSKASYQWYDWKVFFGSSDSLENKFQVFYQERYDWKSNVDKLNKAVAARSVGANYDWLTNRYSTLKTMASYRTLQIRNDELVDFEPENTFLGRVDYRLKLWKNALTSTTFYEVGSGMEQKKEFLYIEVNAGQGVYEWIDYNGDGVKDLNEFEIAQYPDQAKYVRVFTPTDDYVRTYTNEFNQTVFWRPERLWSNKKGFLRFLSRFSNQTRFRVKKKVSANTIQVYNPLARNIADSSLMSYNSTIYNTIYFNRTNPIVGADYTFSKTGSKVLLANGFDARTSTVHTLTARWNFLKKFTLKTGGEIGNKSSTADYTSGRDFDINYYKVNPEFIFQPNTQFRISAKGRYEEKNNKEEFGGEKAYISDFGFEVKWNQLEKGSLTAEVKMIYINFDGVSNNSVSYEMLESLKPGKNFTWTVGYQRNISKNLQVSLQYNGRKSENNKVIHAGGVEIRAFF